MTSPSALPPAYPCFAPAWAEVFGEDDCGLFSECLVKGVRFVWRWIPPGRFLMGSPKDEPGRYDDEGPQHTVILTRGYWLGEAPVTQGQWQAVMGKNPSHFQGPAELPVESVTWPECVEFAGRLNDLVPGLGAALPTEAQWEHACRAGSQTPLYKTRRTTGEITIRGERNAPELDAIAWYGGNSGNELEVTNGEHSTGWSEKQYPHTKAGTHRVKGKEPNAWGLYDMLGNVWEWCADEWSGYPAEPQRDPYVSGTAEAGRVVRGGSWVNDARSCRSACRDWGGPDDRWLNLGLRLAAGQEPRAAEPPGAERRLGPDRR